MKKIIYIFLTIILLYSCDENFLENTPNNSFNDKTFWETPELAEQFVMGIYSELPSDFERYWHFSSITDEAESKDGWNPDQKINTRGFDPNDSYYATYVNTDYYSIRKCNKALEELQKTELLKKDIKNKLIGEVRFLRALYNSTNFMYQGRFQIIEKTLTLKDDLYIGRGTDEECIKLIKDDFKSAIELLPNRSEISASQMGRANKGAAYALLARFLLQIHDYTGAKAACEEVFKQGYELFPTYAGIFYKENENNSEVIFDKQYASGVNYNDHSFTSANKSPRWGSSRSGRTNPSQNIVDAYEFIDGKIGEESVYFDQNNPYGNYENRDPRLVASILYDGNTFKDDVVDLKVGSAYNLETNPSKTGYYIKKFVEPDLPSWQSKNFLNYIIIRLADVYLMYAEALYKLNPSDNNAREYVNKVRRRVNMPDIEAGDFSFESIMHERQVELAFEGSRWFDAVRWKKGPEIIGTTIYGCRVVVDETTNERTYERYKVEDRYWHDKMYLFPISQKLIDEYPEGVLEQNPFY